MNFLKKLFSKKVEEFADVPPEFLQEDQPDWLIDLKGQEPPHGNAFSIRVQLFNAARTGTAEILVLPPTANGQPKTATAEVAATDLNKLFVILGFSFPQEIKSVPAEAADGLPITLTIYRNEPFNMETATCNLTGWIDSRKSGPPVVEIGRILIDVRNQALPK